MNISSWVLWVISFSVLYLWIREKRKLQRQLQQLEQQQGHLDSTLTRFMQECEKTFVEVSRRLSPEALSKASLASTQSQPAQSPLSPGQESKGFCVGAEGSDDVLHRTLEKGAEKKDQVLLLARRGFSVSEIASQLLVPQGEIELILNLKAVPAVIRKPQQRHATA